MQYQDTPTTCPGFRLDDLDEPIVPATPAASGVQAIAVGIVLLVFLPVVVVDTQPDI